MESAIYATSVMIYQWLLYKYYIHNLTKKSMDICSKIMVCYLLTAEINSKLNIREFEKSL